jgi:TolA-binding protein
MADRIDDLAQRVGRLEDRVETMATSLQDLSAAVTAGFVEQREYTEFASSRLEAKMDAGFARVDANAARLEATMDAGFARVDANAVRLEVKMDAGFSRIERKLDQFIDVQLETNQLVGRRLRALES